MSIYGDNIFLNEGYKSDLKSVRDFHKSLNDFHEKNVKRNNESNARYRVTQYFREYLHKYNARASVHYDSYNKKLIINPYKFKDSTNEDIRKNEENIKAALSDTGKISSYLNANIRDHRITCNTANTSLKPYSVNVSIY